jgi:uncharacterized protein YqgV (UPF0045/DUF77 family)
MLQSLRSLAAGVWDQIMDALTAAHDAAVQMIDASVMRVDQHGARVADNKQQHMGRSRGGLTSEIHAVVDANGTVIEKLRMTRNDASEKEVLETLRWAGISEIVEALPINTAPG